MDWIVFMIGIGFLLLVVLVVLLVVMLLRPKKRANSSEKVRNDIKRIKKQINSK